MPEPTTILQQEENPFVARFESFFNTQFKKEIERLVAKYPEKRSLNIDFKDIEHFDYELADEILANPDYLIEAAENAIKNIDIPSLQLEQFSPHIRIFNLPKEQQVQIRDISSIHLAKLISVDGVVKQITDVLPKLKLALWECRRCGNTYKIVQGGQDVRQPAICQCKHKDFELVEDKSTFVDYQKIQIQEPLEFLKGNAQPSNLDLYVSDDIVNMVNAGDRIQMSGILRLYEPRNKKLIYGRYLEVVHVEQTEKEFEEIEILPEEEEKIKALAKDEKIYEMLTQSIAPAIYGHEIVKQSIVLQLFGGVKKLLPDESKIRGNIHILIVGDPGSAKSMLLLAANKIAPKSIYISGKSSTGAGISATAVKDDFGEGGWTIKAGAMVLASGGVAMIDEFDKMQSDDRSALHESLEQQSISVAKAGIVTRFKTETSVLAAANPKFSRFDPFMNFMEQINLPATLISRFDLFFMVRDVLDKEKDREIAKHILETHRAGEILMQAKQKTITLKAAEKEELVKLITPAIAPELFKKYISYARQRINPIMSREAMQKITDFYVGLRDQGRKEGSYSATHRQLEGLVRLSEASARVRLNNEVTEADADRAIFLFKTSLQDVVVDQETGKIDIDIITTGQSHSQTTQLKRVLGIIKSKAAQMDMVPIIDIIEELKVEGMDKDKVMEIISKLRTKGEIYEPRHGFLKPTQKE